MLLGGKGSEAIWELIYIHVSGDNCYSKDITQTETFCLKPFVNNKVQISCTSMLSDQDRSQGSIWIIFICYYDVKGQK